MVGCEDEDGSGSAFQKIFSIFPIFPRNFVIFQPGFPIHPSKTALRIAAPIRFSRRFPHTGGSFPIPYPSPLKNPYEFMESFESAFAAFIHPGIFEYLAEDFTDFLLEYMVDIFRGDLRIPRQEAFRPVGVFRQDLIAAEVFFL